MGRGWHFHRSPLAVGRSEVRRPHSYGYPQGVQHGAERSAPKLRFFAPFFAAQGCGFPFGILNPGRNSALIGSGGPRRGVRGGGDEAPAHPTQEPTVSHRSDGVRTPPGAVVPLDPGCWGAGSTHGRWGALGCGVGGGHNWDNQCCDPGDCSGNPPRTRTPSDCQPRACGMGAQTHRTAEPPSPAAPQHSRPHSVSPSPPRTPSVVP